MRRALVVGGLAMLVVAGPAEARGHHAGRPHAPRAGGRHHAGMAEIKPIRAFGPAEFRPYEPPKPVRPFSYLDHERRDRKPR
jgi:hypothetical protein